MNDDEEEMMESKISRRILAQKKKYISYGALVRNNVPCNRRGRSYYGCAHKANFYRRSCIVITHCYRHTH